MDQIDSAETIIAVVANHMYTMSRLLEEGKVVLADRENRKLDQYIGGQQQARKKKEGSK